MSDCELDCVLIVVRAAGLYRVIFYTKQKNEEVIYEQNMIEGPCWLKPMKIVEWKESDGRRQLVEDTLEGRTNSLPSF